MAEGKASHRMGDEAHQGTNSVLCESYNKTTTWIDPRHPTWQKGELPAGWEMRLNEERRVYFANHTTGTTTWNDPRDQKVSTEPGKQGNLPQTAQSTETTQKLALSSSDELFLVLGTLGQRLIALGVIEDSNLPSAHSIVKKLIPTFSKELSTESEELDIVLQYAITCAVIFSAACYPVHIYRGFGCGVLDDVTWGIHPLETEFAGYGVNEKLTTISYGQAHCRLGRVARRT